MDLHTGLLRTADIRRRLVELYEADPFRPMVEIKGASFLADCAAIIGKPNQKYIEAELEWYNSMSLNINDIPGGPPKMWRRTANPDGFINSNYGWVMWSAENGCQANEVFRELRRDFASRRAMVIYTRPSMHVDQHLGGGGQDFMCTNAVQYTIDPQYQRVDAVVQMRSNDVVFGYRNDYAWQSYALDHIVSELKHDWPELEAGHIYWQAMSLHVYPRHYGLLRSISQGQPAAHVSDGEV